MRQSFAIGMGLVGAVCLAALTAASAEDKPLTIGVSHQSLGFPYAVALENGELKAAKELGGNGREIVVTERRVARRHVPTDVGIKPVRAAVYLLEG